MSCETKYFNHYERNFRPNESEIREHKDEWSSIDWKTFSKNYKLSKDFMREFRDEFSMSEIIENENIDYDFFSELIKDETYEVQMNWKLAFLAWRLDKKWLRRDQIEEIIRKELVFFFCHWDWHVVTELIKPSTRFIKEEMISRGMWIDVLSIKDLSDRILDEYKNEIDWKQVSFFHDLSESFIEKYRDLLDKETIDKRLEARPKWVKYG